MISFVEGIDFDQPVTCTDRQGNAIDLTSATLLTCTVYPEPREGAIASMTLTATASEITVVSASTGQIKLLFEHDNAEALSAGEYTYEITATLSDGTVVFLGRDALQVLPSNVY